MSHFVIRRYKECLAVLERGYNTCGVNLVSTEDVGGGGCVVVLVLLLVVVVAVLVLVVVVVVVRVVVGVVVVILERGHNTYGVNLVSTEDVGGGGR